MSARNLSQENRLSSSSFYDDTSSDELFCGDSYTTVRAQNQKGCKSESNYFTDASTRSSAYMTPKGSRSSTTMNGSSRNSITETYVTASIGAESPDISVYKLSFFRWFILVGLVIIGLTDGLDELSSILKEMCRLLDLDRSTYSYFNLLSRQLSTAIFALPSAIIFDRLGLKKTLHVALGLIYFRTTFAYFLFSPSHPNYDRFRYFYWIIWSCTCGMSRALYLSLPLRVSEMWFSVKERTLAWSLFMMAIPIGSGLGNFLYSYIVITEYDVSKIANLNLLIALICTIVVLFFFTRSNPKNPPSERSVKSTSASKQSLLRSVKIIFWSPSLLLVTSFIPIVDGPGHALTPLSRDILNDTLSQQFVGTMLVILYFSASISHITFAYLIKDTENNLRLKTFVYKYLLAFNTLGFCINLFSLSSYIQTTGWIVILTSVCSIILKQLACVNVKNLSTFMISGLVSEAKFSSIGLIIGLCIQNLDNFLLLYFRKVDQITGDADYNISFITLSALPVTYTIIFCLFFEAQSPRTMSPRIPGTNINGIDISADQEVNQTETNYECPTLEAEATHLVHNYNIDDDDRYKN